LYGFDILGELSSLDGLWAARPPRRAPLPLTGEAVDAVCRNVKLWQETVGVPLLIENITKMVVLPGELTEAQFTTEVVERSDCSLLLDLHNLHTNAVNQGFDPFELLDVLPLERVGQVHLAGGHEDEEGYRYDSHSARRPSRSGSCCGSLPRGRA
jgi:uncharacterized protein